MSHTWIPPLYTLREAECEHDWVLDNDWRDGIVFKCDCLRVPQHCSICGKKSYELWTYAGVLDRETLDVIEYA